MAASVVAICNIALDAVGAKAITSLEDGTTAANLCSRNYEAARDAVLRKYPWNDAAARARLAASATAPAWGFAYSYPLPVDCLRVVAQDGDQLDGVAWRVEGRDLLTDEAGPVDIRYVRKLPDPGLIGPLLADTIAAELAARICYGLTGNATLTQTMIELAEIRLRDARRMDAIEQSQDEAITADQWTNARFRSYGAR